LAVVHGPGWFLLLPALAGSSLASGASSTGQFAISISLSPPAGCVSNVTVSGAGSASTMTCGANLFVNVQPTVMSASSTTQPVAAPPAGPGGVGEVAPPSDAGPGLAALFDINDRRTSAGGAVYVERRSPLFDTGSGALPMSLNPPTSTADNKAGQAMELWLTF
jgi:hypothetical protein